MLTTGESNSVTLGKARHKVCLEAAWELEALAYMLPTMVPNTDEDSGAHYAARTIGSRILALSIALMSALDDKVKNTSDLEAVVFVKSKFSGIEL